ncbi:MAG: hypothetical protein A3H69_04620 [Candidatus Sungbacteria bacterium RIFCSPLOWO2_02_FULL_47_9]|nr:MAG: hypothetical protein A3H69_04620 [Candidatus Sungbacteria bacterium RIFCSPLOWO2_02_FULL_47_9]
MKRTDEKIKTEIPASVRNIIEKLGEAGFEGYAVGGCVRDLLLGRTPDDWDIATNAKPEEIQKIFPENFYANQFLTVTVKTGSAEQSLEEVEVTTFRAEGSYTDKRHPDEIRFAATLEEDLSRRDFTINAIALSVNGDTVDPFGGKKDLEKKTIRTVGEPEKRFEEDALRMLRAVRFAARLGFEIEKETLEAIKKNAPWLQAISKERIRDEFTKIISLPNAKEGIELLRETLLLKFILPELLDGYGITQNKHHIYTVWDHNLKALEYAVSQNWSPTVRIAALFHDIAKPHTKQGEGPNSTFYGHDVVGGRMGYEILTRLRFPRDVCEKVSKLVRWHLFNYKLRKDVEEEIRKELNEKPDPKDPEDADMSEGYTTDSSIRRLIRNIGAENIEDLVKVRICDRIGSGVPKAVPYRLRHFQYRVEKIIREHEAVSVGMLKVNGEDIKKLLGVPAGPKIGHMLQALLEEVLDEPKKNVRELLLKRIEELNKMSETELIELRKKAEERVELIEESRDKEIKKKYWVK